MTVAGFWYDKSGTCWRPDILICFLNLETFRNRSFYFPDVPITAKMPPKRKAADADALSIEPIKEPAGSKHPDPPHPNLPSHEFSCLMVAPRGSGKTTLVLNLISKLYKKYFQRVVVFSPTMHGDEKWNTVKKQKDILAKWDDPLDSKANSYEAAAQKKQRQEDPESDSEDEGAGGGRKDGHEPSLYAASWHSLFAKVTPGPVPAMHADTRSELEDIAKRGGAKLASDGKTKKWTGKLQKQDLYVDVFEEDLSKVMKESMDGIDKLRRKGITKHKAKRTLIVFDGECLYQS
ncbi:MAG: DEAD/DEAH box helicase family protein [Fluviibacter sp.]